MQRVGKLLLPTRRDDDDAGGDVIAHFNRHKYFLVSH